MTGIRPALHGIFPAALERSRPSHPTTIFRNRCEARAAFTLRALNEGNFSISGSPEGINMADIEPEVAEALPNVADTLIAHLDQFRGTLSAVRVSRPWAAGVKSSAQ